MAKTAKKRLRSRKTSKRRKKGGFLGIRDTGFKRAVANFFGKDEDTYRRDKLDKLEINYHKYIKISTKKNQHGSSEIKISNLIDILKFCNYIYNQPKSQKLALPRKMQRYHKLLKRINNFFNLRKESFIIEYKGPLKHNFYYNIQKFGKQIYGKACLTKKEAQEKRDLKFKEVFGEDKFYQYFGPLEKAILTDKYNRENL